MNLDELKFWFRSWHVGMSRIFCDHSDDLWELQQVRRTWTHWLTRQYVTEAPSHFNAAESASHVDLMKSEDVHLLWSVFLWPWAMLLQTPAQRLLDNHHKLLFHLTESTLKAVLLMWKHTWALAPETIKTLTLQKLPIQNLLYRDNRAALKNDAQAQSRLWYATTISTAYTW